MDRDFFKESDEFEEDCDDCENDDDCEDGETCKNGKCQKSLNEWDDYDDYDWPEDYDDDDDDYNEKYTLVGVDGNAFSVMGYVSQCMKSEGMSQEEIKQYREDAMSGDYNHLLVVSQEMIEFLNEQYQ